MTDDNGTVVDLGVSRFGLHRLHVVRMGAAVDAEAWIKERVPEGGMVETWLKYEEKGLGLHHLHLFWREGGIASQRDCFAKNARNDMEEVANG